MLETLDFLHFKIIVLGLLTVAWPWLSWVSWVFLIILCVRALALVHVMQSRIPEQISG